MGQKNPADFASEGEIGDRLPAWMVAENEAQAARLQAEDDLRIRMCALDQARAAMADIMSVTDDKRDYADRATALAAHFESYLRTGATS